MFDTDKLNSFNWINVAHPDHDDFSRLQRYYDIEEDTITDILDPDEQSRVETEDDYKNIIVRFPIVNRETETAWHTEPLSIIYAPNRVITICRKRCDALDKIKSREKDSREMLILNALYYISESYLKSLKELNRKVFTAKTNLQKKISKSDLMQLLEIENSYTLYMSGIKGNIGVVEKLEKIRAFKATEDLEDLLEDVKIELSQASEIITSYSKMLRAVKDTFYSATQIDANLYINRLTIWNIILMIPTIIVGYYGMNVALPFAGHSHAALWIFLMILGFVGIFATIWWRKRH
ncbi:MAG: magnesium transporter CorA family protein [Rickettsiales bacterium]|jgi:magnesium transporter|nr:magnesium transporter CorA family protein [Rickettsiales bacterium]